MKAKKYLKMYEELRIKIRDLIRSVTKQSDHSDDKLPLNKTI